MFPLDFRIKECLLKRMKTKKTLGKGISEVFLVSYVSKEGFNFGAIISLYGRNVTVQQKAGLIFPQGLVQYGPFVDDRKVVCF